MPLLCQLILSYFLHLVVDYGRLTNLLRSTSIWAHTEIEVEVYVKQWG